MRPPLKSTLFPYTTLFRSGGGELYDYAEQPAGADADCVRGQPLGDADDEQPVLHQPGTGILRGRVQPGGDGRSEEHTSELQSHVNLVCRLLLEKKNNTK